MTLAPDIAAGPTKHSTPMRVCAEVAVRWIVAGVLLVAAALKAEQVATEPMHGSGLLAWRPFWIALVEYEAMLGFWLLSGLWMRLSRLIALVTLLGFTSFAIYQAWQGQPSCGCMGKAPVSPWVMIVIDSVLAAGLFGIRSKVSRENRLRRRSAFLALGALASVLAIPTMLGLRPLALVHAPSLMPDMDVYDFGTIKPDGGLRVAHEFRIENRSDRPIRILGSKTTCGCTAAAIPTESIAPGAFAMLRIDADLRGRFGIQQHQILLTTDSPTQSSLALGIRANIVAPVVFWPGVVDFGDVVEGQMASRKVVVAPGARQPTFRIVSAVPDDPLIAVVEEDAPAARPGEHTLKVKLSAASPKSDGRASIRATLDLQSGESVEIPIRYSVTPAIQITPTALVFWSGQSPSRDLSITSVVDLANAEIVSGELDPSAFDIQLERTPATGGAVGRYVLHLKLMQMNIPRLVKAQLIVSAGQFSAEIPVLVMPQKNPSQEAL